MQSASISTSQPRSIRPFTSTNVEAGLIFENASPCARVASSLDTLDRPLELRRQGLDRFRVVRGRSLELRDLLRDKVLGLGGSRLRREVRDRGADNLSDVGKRRFDQWKPGWHCDPLYMAR